MRSRPFLLVSLAIFAAFAAGFTVQKSRSMYRNDELGIAFRDPQFFDNLKPGFGMVATFSAPAENNFAANVNIIRQPAQNRDDFMAVNKRSVEAMGFEVIDNKAVDINDHEAVETIYTGQMGSLKMKFLSVAIIDRNAVYLITGTATEDSFDKYERNFRRVIDSFQFR